MKMSWTGDSKLDFCYIKSDIYIETKQKKKKNNNNNNNKKNIKNTSQKQQASGIANPWSQTKTLNY